MASQKRFQKKRLGLINSYTIGNFQELLKNETWNQIYD